MIVTVEIIQDKALNLLSDMEHLDLIRLHVLDKNAVGNGAAVPEEKLSGRFAGVLCLSDDRYNEYQNTLQEGRTWIRDIY